MPQAPQPSFDFTGYLTPLVRNLLIVLVVIYFAQLFTGNLLITLFAWGDIGASFRPWQVFTSFFLSGPDPFSAVFTWLALFFFTGTVYGSMPRRTFWRVLVGSWGVSSVVTIGLQALGLIGGYQLGMQPVCAWLVALFGLRNPHAQVLFYFLPIKAIWLARVSAFIELLWFLYAPSPMTSLALLFTACAWAWSWYDSGGARRTRLEWKRRDIERKLSKFEVIEGGRDRRKADDWVN